jgi:hypothetical protein
MDTYCWRNLAMRTRDIASEHDRVIAFRFTARSHFFPSKPKAVAFL